jgi:hypothetical protein
VLALTSAEEEVAAQAPVVPGRVFADEAVKLLPWAASGREVAWGSDIGPVSGGLADRMHVGGRTCNLA